MLWGLKRKLPLAKDGFHQHPTLLHFLKRSSYFTFSYDHPKGEALWIQKEVLLQFPILGYDFTLLPLLRRTYGIPSHYAADPCGH